MIVISLHDGYKTLSVQFNRNIIQIAHALVNMQVPVSAPSSTLHQFPQEDVMLEILEIRCSFENSQSFRCHLFYYFVVTFLLECFFTDFYSAASLSSEPFITQVGWSLQV